MKVNGMNKIQHKFYTKCANKSQKSHLITTPRLFESSKASKRIHKTNY